MRDEDGGAWKAEAGTGALVTLPFLFWLYQYINLDFWYDEIWSLLHYTFAPLSRTVTDYAVPNNHILFNLIDNLYLKCVGVKDLYALMDAPYVIRLLPLGYTLLTVLFVYLIGRRYFDRFVACVSVVILITTVPFYNFALQVRGYGLSTLLLSAMWYHGWGLEERIGLRDSVLFVLSATLSLYTLPSNLYFHAAIGAFYLALGILEGLGRKVQEGRKGKPATPKPRDGSRFAAWQAFCGRNRCFSIIALLGVGILLATLLYLPVIGSVAEVMSGKDGMPFYGHTLTATLPTVYFYFLSHRYLFLPVVAMGLYVGFCKRPDAQSVRRLALCLALLLLPFVFCFVKGDQPPDRVFVILTPVFAVLVAKCLSLLLGCVIPGGLARNRWVALALVFLYCNVTFSFCIDRVHKRLRENLAQGEKAQDLYYNYYQAYYHPLEVIGDFARKYQKGSPPVVVCEGDVLAAPQYLKKFGVTPYDCGLLEEMVSKPDRHSRLGWAFVIAVSDLRKLGKSSPYFECERLAGPVDFFSIYLLVRKAG